MYKGLKTCVIIPALNEELAISKVIKQLLALRHCEQNIIDHIIVCDNGSSDNTSTCAELAGAEVVKQNTPGYGIACLTAMEHLPHCDIVLFVDGDDSCFAPQALTLLEGIYQGDDLAIGSRTLGQIERGALTPVQLFGNALSAWLINFFWHCRITDLGPYRAIRSSQLKQINMQDRSFGWTVEMQVKCIQRGLKVSEYAVDSKVRIGESKISGTIKGSVKAGIGILLMIAKLRWQQNPKHAKHSC